MRKITRWTIVPVAAVLVTFLVTIGIFSIGRVGTLDDDALSVKITLVSKNLVIRGIYAADRMIHFTPGSQYGPPTPIHSGVYRYQDPSHPYFEAVRADPRLAHLYSDPGGFDFESAVAMADFIRGQFRHGRSTFPHDDLKLLELLDLVDRGERFQCGTISKMLAQMVQASGGYARLIFLPHHVVVEIWAPDFEKWALLDPDFNVHYVGDDGVPLSTLEIHHALNEGDTLGIHPMPGESSNTIYSARSQPKLYRTMGRGFAVCFFDKWVSAPLPRWDPYRSPVTTAVYYSENEGPDNARFYYARRVNDPSVLYAPPEPHPPTP